MLPVLQAAIAALPSIVVPLHDEVDLMANLLQEGQVAGVMIPERRVDPIQCH